MSTSDSSPISPAAEPSSRPPTEHRLIRVHDRARWSALALLACCAGLIATRGLAGAAAPPDPSTTTAAVALALGSIVARRLSTSPALALRKRVAFSIASFTMAAGLGIIGVHLALALDTPRTGLLFTLAGAIFSARRPQFVGV